LTINLKRAIELIIEKGQKKEKTIIKEFAENDDIKVIDGRYGPYISAMKANYKIPKSRKPEELTLEDCLEIVEQSPATTSKSRFSKSPKIQKKIALVKKLVKKSKATQKKTGTKAVKKPVVKTKK
jgi:DNA topoisomerase-1